MDILSVCFKGFLRQSTKRPSVKELPAKAAHSRWQIAITSMCKRPRRRGNLCLYTYICTYCAPRHCARLWSIYNYLSVTYIIGGFFDFQLVVSLVSSDKRCSSDCWNYCDYSSRKVHYRRTEVYNFHREHHRSNYKYFPMNYKFVKLFQFFFMIKLVFFNHVALATDCGP